MNGIYGPVIMYITVVFICMFNNGSGYYKII